MNVLCIAVAGALGALSRYGVDAMAASLLGRAFPYGTLIANVLGCFLMGLVMHWSLSQEDLPRHVHLLLTTGFLGAFTTFSTFSYQTIDLLERGLLTAAGVNVLLSVVIGLLAVSGGLFIGRAIV